MDKRDFADLFENQHIQMSDGSSAVIRPLTGPSMMELRSTGMISGAVNYAVAESILVDFTDAPMLHGKPPTSRQEIRDEMLSRVVRFIQPTWIAELVQHAVINATLTEDERKNSS